MIDLVVSQVPGADKSVVVPNGMRMGAAAILDHLAPGAGARLELWHGSRRLGPAERPRAKLVRRAGIGFCSSFASDCVSNGMRVVKTYKQTSLVPLSYAEARARARPRGRFSPPRALRGVG